MNKKLEITTYLPCVNSCHYCPQKLLKDRYNGNNVMSVSDFHRVLDNSPWTDIHFSGFSEPLAHPYIIEIINAASSGGGDVKLFTTLSSIDARCDYSGIDILCDMYVHVPHRNARWEEEWVLNLHRLDRYTLIKVGDNHSNFIKTFLSRTDKKIIDQPIVTRAGNCGGYDNREENTGKELRCKDNREYQNVVLPNGDVHICCMDYALEYKIGNIYEQTLDEIHDSKPFKEFRENMKKGKTFCTKCFRGVYD